MRAAPHGYPNYTEETGGYRAGDDWPAQPLPECGKTGSRAVESGEQFATRGGVAQQIAERLLACKGVEDFLVFHRGGKERLLLFWSQSTGGVSAQKLPDVLRPHGRLPLDGAGGSQLPPIASSRFLRQR